MSVPPVDLLADDIDPGDLDTGDLIALIEASLGDIETFLASEDLHETLETVAISPVRERPNALIGTTQRIDTGYDHIYVNINIDADGRPVELFTTYGQSGGFTKSMTEAIHNLATLALRSNAAPEDVVDQLRDIRSPRVGYDHGTRVDSIPDAIGLALDRVVNDDLHQITPHGDRQSSLTHHGDDEEDTDETTATTNCGYEASEEADSADVPTPEGESPADDDSPENSEGASSVEDSDGASGVPLDAPDEVSVSGAPDHEIEPAGVPDAEPGTDPHLEEDPPAAKQTTHPHSSDTEPCPECGSIDIFYSEGCMTCQNCGFSECG